MLMPRHRKLRQLILAIILSASIFWFSVPGAMVAVAEVNQGAGQELDSSSAQMRSGIKQEGYIGAMSDQNPREHHNGVAISGVVPHGPADRAGIQVGDAILSVNGHYVSTPEELKSEVGNLQPGSRADIRYQRNAAINETYVLVGEQPQGQPASDNRSGQSPQVVTVSQVARPPEFPPKASITEPSPALSRFVLEDGTPVKLRISRTVSSGDAHVGDNVDFEVLEEVVVGNITVIPKGGLALATVTEAQPKRRMARGGKLGMNIDSVRLADGEKVALRAVKEVKGGGHTGAMTGAMVGTAIVFFPAAPLFLFMHGKDITIPKGTEITAYINGNDPLNIARFQPTVATPASESSRLIPAELKIDISSTPPGADIELDGSFVGNTPSSMTVPPGEHSVKITKSGYKDWSRKLKAMGGNITISADLERVSGSRRP